MNIDDLNKSFAELHNKPGREQMLETAFSLVEWLGLKPPKEGRERVLAPRLEKLKDYLIRHPFTRQHQFYRLTEKDQCIIVRLAVLKKLRKDFVTQLIDKENPLDFQGAPPVIQSMPSAPPYFIHFATTPEYDRIYLILHQGGQKRIVSFRKKLTHTQFLKIVPQWKNIASKSKPVIAEQLWKSLDIRELNKDFYELIKKHFDALLDIVKKERTAAHESGIKQFAIRLIGRYIFCWFLKEKGIIPEALLSSKTIQENKNIFFQTCLYQLFFNTLNEEVQNRSVFQTGTSLDELYNNIPYLNGGLFDKHPEDDLFFQIALNEWLIGFVKVLESFDFTVDESSSWYQQVAIDPEMLGRVFENLLASQNEETASLANQRKAYGAFYTPREIVDYMVNESLKVHLETHILPKLPHQENENIVREPSVAYSGSLFQYSEPRQMVLPLSGKQIAEREEAQKKCERLKEKIKKFIEPGCSDNPFDKDETRQVRNGLQNITVLDPACGSGAFPMGMMLRLMELRHLVGHWHKNNYDLKNEILSKNIYGVDIMPMAVEIARLRAWLSLVLEAEYKPSDRKNNFGIAALPNLDFKFVCANSLIDSGYDDFLKKSELNITLYRFGGEIQNLERIRDAYFDPKGDKSKKEGLQKEFEQTKLYIKEQINVGTLKKNYKLEDFFNKVDDWNPFDDSKPSSFFSPGWMFGIREGFDVVIGNPPWGQKAVKFSDLEKKYFKINYPAATNGILDIFRLFLERSINLVRNHGCFINVLPDIILLKNYDSSRKHILHNLLISEIIHWGMAFENVNLDSCTLIGRKSIFIRKDNIVSCKVVENNKITTNYILQSQFLQTEGYKFNLFLNHASFDLLEKLKKHKKFCDYFEPHEGIHSGNIRSKLFVDKKENNNYHKLIFGRDEIGRFYLLWKGKWVNYDKNIINKNNGEYAGLGNPKYFENPKIVVRRTGDYILAAFDENGYYFSNNVFVCLPKKNSAIDMRYVLGILNSNLSTWFYRTIQPRKGKLFAELKINVLKQIPLLDCSEYKKNQIISLVNQIITKKKEEPDTDIICLKNQINQIVYSIFKLNEDEVNLIETQTNN